MGLGLNTKSSKSFKVISMSEEPIIEFIPTEDNLRKEMYDRYLSQGISLPDYNLITAPDLHKVDLIVLSEDFSITVSYLNNIYTMNVKKGTIWDAASVPVCLEIGRISKISQYCLAASLCHDLLYSHNYLPCQEANDWFEGILKYKDLNIIAVWFYVAGVRVEGPARYVTYTNVHPWTAGFVEFITNGIKDPK